MKASDEELKQDLENGLSFEEIKEKHGYSDKGQVSRRVKNADFELSRNSKLSFLKRGGANIYLGYEVVDQMLESAGLGKDAEDVFVEKRFNETRGVLELRVTGDRWSGVEEGGENQ